MSSPWDEDEKGTPTKALKRTPKQEAKHRKDRRRDVRTVTLELNGETIAKIKDMLTWTPKPKDAKGQTIEQRIHDQIDEAWKSAQPWKPATKKDRYGY